MNEPSKILQDSEKVQITLTAEQADVVKKALDLYTRMSLGQMHVIDEMVRQQEIPANPNKPEIQARQARYDEISHYCKGIKAALGFNHGESLGIGHRHVPLAGLRAYEVRAVLAKTLAEKLTSPHYSLDRDGLILRYTQDEAPTASWV